MRTTVVLIVLATTMLAAAPHRPPAYAGSTTAGDWQTYVNARYGFSLSVPHSIFVSGAESTAAETGRVWVSRDGRDRLVASAGVNESRETPSSYRAFVLQKTYSDARITYSPIRSRWFVLSGVKDDRMFYERITFACQGSLIYGWQITYPASERHVYDAIVEAIHKSYRPGNRDTGPCRQP